MNSLGIVGYWGVYSYMEARSSWALDMAAHGIIYSKNQMVNHS